MQISLLYIEIISLFAIIIGVLTLLDRAPGGVSGIGWVTGTDNEKNKARNWGSDGLMIETNPFERYTRVF